MNTQRRGLQYLLILGIGVCACLIFAFVRFVYMGERILYRETRFLLGAQVRIDICARRSHASPIAKSFARAWKEVRDVQTFFSAFDPKSDVSRINASYPQAIEVWPETARVIRVAEEYCRATQGAFDITVAGFSQIWQDAQRDQVLPDSARILVRQHAVGCDRVSVDSQQRVQLHHPQTRIDLSGLGQGFAADRVAQVLRKDGWKDFLIDMGGEIVASGYNAHRRLWRVGIKDPRDAATSLKIISLNHQAVSTSGNYERSYVIEGKSYAQIINPVSGYPQEGVISATVITDTAFQADMLSTALCVLGPEPGMALLSALHPQAAAVIVVENSSGERTVFHNDAFEILAANSQ